MLYYIPYYYLSVMALTLYFHKYWLGFVYLRFVVLSVLDNCASIYLVQVTIFISVDILIWNIVYDIYFLIPNPF